MKKRKQYWLLLPVLVLAANLILTPGSTYAHYQNVAKWNTVLFPENVAVASNCLVPDGKQTILLGDLPESGKPYEFTLEGEPGTAAPIYWNLNEEAEPYLDAELRLGNTQLSGSQILTIPESGKLELTLFLKPVMTRAHDAIPTSIAVRWGGDPVTGENTPENPLLLAGTFRTVLKESIATVTATLGDVPLSPEGAVLDLGDLPREGLSLELTLTSDKEMAQTLDWNLEEALGEYLDVTVTREGQSIRSGSEIKLEYDAETQTVVPAVLTVTLTPVNRVRQAMPVELNLTWGELTGLISATLPEAPATSDLLTPEGTTVFLEELPPEGRTLTFTLSALADTEAPLTWTSNSPYLTVTLSREGTALSSGNPVAVAAGQTVEIALTLMPGTEPREATLASVDLNWGELLGVTLAVQLESVAGEEPEPTEPAEPEEPEVPEEPTEPEITEPVVDPMTNTEPEAPADEPETTEPEPTEAPDVPEATEPTEPESTEPEPTEPPHVPVSITMNTLGNFTANGLIPVELTVSTNTEHIFLSQAATSDPASPMGLLPPFTRYTLDGENYFLLYNGGSIHLTGEELPAVPEGQDPTATMTVLLFLDVSATELAGKLDLILMAQTVGNGTEQAEARSVLQLAMGDDLTQAMILTRNEPLTLTLPESWKPLTPKYTVEGLRVNEGDDRQPSLESYVVDSTQIQVARVSMESEKHVLNLRVGTQPPAAGTYVLTLTWYYQGVCIEQTQITFFVNYATIAVPEETGGTEP